MRSRLISTCLLLLIAYLPTSAILSRLNDSLKIPSIPTDHLLCWFGALSESSKDTLNKLCSNRNYDGLDLDDWNVDKSSDSLLLKQLICQHFQLARAQPQLAPCWGYEVGSNQNCLLYKPDCPGGAESWAPNKVEQLQIFFNTADFGYVRERRSELEHYCLPNSDSNSFVSSELKCTKYMRYCAGKNVYLNLGRLARVKEPIRYREDVLEYGDIGGWNCTLDRPKLLKEGDHKSPLMSWFAEMSQFKVVNSSDDSDQNLCDITLDKPTFVMKLDATVNMYHHFCDFVNLYMSLHVNGSHFNRDNQILLWDTYPYWSNFAPVWSAFTRNPILTLSQFRGKRVCFREVTFPLLPRMIYGLYYNMPLIPGCGRSGLFRAFNRHLLFHLGQNSSEESLVVDTIRVTFISRQTKHRRVLNEVQLIAAFKQALAEKGEHQVEIRMEDFHHRMPFLDQVAITSQSDVLIGMHGAGLTHTVFQPDYGVLFELYNCQDPECYKDLARLRGIHYLTWRNESKLRTVEEDNSQAADREALGAAHAKFVNYHFDAQEFVAIALEAVEQAKRRKQRFFEERQKRAWHHLESIAPQGALQMHAVEQRPADKRPMKSEL